MKQPRLYAVLLGGKIRKKNLMEDHHLVFVVAENEKQARVMAKKKWQADTIHVDGTQRIDAVDGYSIVLKKSPTSTDTFRINNNYTV